MKSFNQFISNTKIDEFYDPSKKSGGGGEPKNFKDVLYHAHKYLERVSGSSIKDHDRHISDDGDVTIIGNPENSHEVSVNKSHGSFAVLHTDTEGNHHNLQWNSNMNRYEPETRKQ